MSYTTINYKQGRVRKTVKYESVEVHYGKDKKKFFNSGDFVKDWYDRVKFIITKIGEKEMHVSSSTVNHFIMDGAPYDSAWLKTTEKTAKLIYEFDGKLIEFFVPEGTQPTWDELRKLCGDPKKKKNEPEKAKRSSK